MWHMVYTHYAWDECITIALTAMLADAKKQFKPRACTH